MDIITPSVYTLFKGCTLATYTWTPSCLNRVVNKIPHNHQWIGIYLKMKYKSLPDRVTGTQIIKNVAQSKRQRYVRFVDSLQERWFGILHLLIYWMVWEGDVVFFEIWIHQQNQSFNCRGVFHDRSFQLSARWDPPFPRNIFKVLPHW